MECIIRPLAFRNLTAVAALVFGLAACSTDSPTAPGSQSVAATSVSAKTTSSDIAIAAGNSIASDIQNLTANELAAVSPGLVAITARLNDQAGGTTGSSNPPSSGGTLRIPWAPPNHGLNASDRNRIREISPNPSHTIAR